MRHALIALALVACSKSKTESPPDEPAPITNQQLAAAPLVTTSSTAGGVAFTIDLPVSLLGPAEVKDAYATWEPKHAGMDAPSFTVKTLTDLPLGPDETGDAQPMGDDAKDRKIVRAEKLADGGYLNVDERVDRAFYVLEVCRPHGSARMCCTVVQRDSKPIESFEPMLAMAEKVCRSMKPK